jgi:hypothetical protein
MQKTASELVIAVQNALSQVSGSSVQLYSEDQIAASINKMYRFLRREADWPHLSVWETVTLDGTVGIPNGNMTQITSFDDIFAIYPSSSQRKLDPLPMDINPFLISGSRARFFTQYNNAALPLRLFQVFPVASTDTLYVNGRIPEPTTDFDPDDVVPFDADCLTQYAAWDYATDDGANPTQMDKLLNTAETRLKQLKRGIAKPIVLSNNASVPNQWSEVP